jgi:hypothetical protein
MITSQERVESRQSGLMIGLVVGTEIGASAGIGDGGLTTVGEGERWLIASANDDNCDEMVDKGI